MRNHVFGFLIATSLCLLATHTGAGPQQKHVLSGQVLDPNDKGIGNVRIRIHRGSEPVIEDNSKPDGTYSISFADGKPVDRIEYDLTGWNHAVISDLSGRRDHSVHKTLYHYTKIGADPAKLDPKHFKVEFENEEIRVLRWTVDPHEKTPILDYRASVFVPLTDSYLRDISIDGKTEDLRWDAGQTIWRAPAARAIENRSDRRIESIVVELKGRSAYSSPAAKPVPRE